MNAHYFFFAIHTPTGQVECYATKYVPCTDYKPSRFRFWRINNGLERIGTAKTVSWNHDTPGHGHDEQLQAALGEQWQVLPFHKVCSILSSSIQSEK